MTAPTTPEQDREAFEAWYGKGYSFDLARDVNGEYAHAGPVLQWEAWQARAALAAPASPWLPIESAPKDGTTYLAADGSGTRRIENQPECHYAGSWVWSKSRKHWRGCAHDDLFEASIWMALPAAPLAGPVEQGEQG